MSHFISFTFWILLCFQSHASDNAPSFALSLDGHPDLTWNFVMAHKGPRVTCTVSLTKDQVATNTAAWPPALCAKRRDELLRIARDLRDPLLKLRPGCAQKISLALDEKRESFCLDFANRVLKEEIVHWWEKNQR